MAQETTIDEGSEHHVHRAPACPGQAPPARRPNTRTPKRRLRAFAWLAAGIGFALPARVIALTPKPPAASAPVQRPVVIVRRTIRRIVITPQGPTTPPPRVRYVYGGGGAVGSPSAGTTRCSGC